MRNIILFDKPDVRENLLPITFTRPISDIRIGITTIKEKWQRYFPEASFSYWTTEYLHPKFSTIATDDNYFIAANIIPDNEIVETIKNLQSGEWLTANNGWDNIAFRGRLYDFETQSSNKVTDYQHNLTSIKWLYDIFSLNDKILHDDFLAITSKKESQPLSDTNTIIGNRYFEDGTPKIFVEEGAIIEGAFLNVNNGPIYIGKDCEIMEGSCIRAPFAACEHSIVNMGSKIYGATTLGPYCKVGGELNNVVMIGYSNKGHDGFLGNAVIGEWCNLGAGCSASNLKNDYTEIKLWNYPAHRFLRTGLQFCGLIMGDHSKAGVNSIFNTATVIGVGVNIHGTGFPRNFVPSFSEGSSAGFTDVSLAKFFAVAERVMARRNVKLTDTDKQIFQNIFDIADNYK
ncbi:MAG: glucose-1-phosphate thymidylyltransferase [Bacteroidales bacterium]|nr:glucose-1-phosphate thymidylyltransferase [Bacteroidales bacterium]